MENVIYLVEEHERWDGATVHGAYATEAGAVIQASKLATDYYEGRVRWWRNETNGNLNAADADDLAHPCHWYCVKKIALQP